MGDIRPLLTHLRPEDVNDEWLSEMDTLIRGRTLCSSERVQLSRVVDGTCWRITEPALPDPHDLIDGASSTLVLLLTRQELLGWCDRWLTGRTPWPDETAKGPQALFGRRPEPWTLYI